MPSNPIHHYVVVGGGAGGIELAIRLAKRLEPTEAKVTLIDRCATHLWKPRLHEVAAGLMVPADEETSFAAQAARHGFTFVLGEMAGIDPAQRVIDVAAVDFPSDLYQEAEPAPLLPARKIPYDTAILAIGSTVNDFGTPGVAEHCYTLDAPEQALRVNRAILAQAARVAAGEATQARVAIIGAGTTGVELAAELRTAAHRLAEYRSLRSENQLSIAIADMADRPLPAVDEATSAYARRMLEKHRVEMHFNAQVKTVEPGLLHFADGRTLEADILVWATGIRGHRVLSSVSGLTADRSGRIHTDDYLRIHADTVEPGSLYCLGDCGTVIGADGKPSVPATAQAAHQQAAYLAGALLLARKGKAPRPFRFRYMGTLVSLGQNQAVGNLPSAPVGRGLLKVRGPGAKLMYSSLYRMHTAQLFGWVRTIALTLSDLLRRSAMPSIKLYWS